MTKPLQVADPLKAIRELPPIPEQDTLAEVNVTPEAQSTRQASEQVGEGAIELVGLIDIQGPQLGWGNTQISLEFNTLSLLIGVVAGYFLAIILGKA